MKFEEIRDALAVRTASLVPEEYSGADAARLTEVGAEIVKLGEAVTLLFAKRAADTGAWTRTSHAVSAEQWLAGVSGTSEHAARETLTTADRLASLPATADTLRAGGLSLAQAAQVTAAASVAPGSEEHLIHVATHRGFRELRSEKERVIAWASDEAKGREQARKERHLRTWTRGYATHGTFSGPTEQIAEILAALKPLERDAFDTARRAGRHESHDAYRFDALVGLARSAAAPTAARSQNSDVVRVRVDLGSLLDGKTREGEVCEIPGVGPVPVDHARKVLSHGLLELVISDGVDVQTVVSTTRHVPVALRIAVDERDQGRCKVRDCDHTRALERHHTLGFAENRITRYGVLGGVCPDHHDLITHRGYEVVENGDGTWSLRAPPKSDAA
ncbi:MAG: DUF222 domain-containing protein [Acidimicrobiia bacterium]|nr:DUF222 domain-containing protein [Acidimicrobiia bacterium]